MQLTKWAETKRLTGWYSKRVAVGENGEIKGVGQLLFKRYRSYHLHYAITWIVADYNDRDVLRALLNETKIAKEEKSVCD